MTSPGSTSSECTVGSATPTGPLVARATSWRVQSRTPSRSAVSTPTECRWVSPDGSVTARLSGGCVTWWWTLNCVGAASERSWSSPPCNTRTCTTSVCDYWQRGTHTGSTSSSALSSYPI